MLGILIRVVFILGPVHRQLRIGQSTKCVYQDLQERRRLAVCNPSCSLSPLTPAHPDNEAQNPRIIDRLVLVWVSFALESETGVVNSVFRTTTPAVQRVAKFIGGYAGRSTEGMGPTC